MVERVQGGEQIQVESRIQMQGERVAERSHDEINGEEREFIECVYMVSQMIEPKGQA